VCEFNAEEYASLIRRAQEAYATAVGRRQPAMTHPNALGLHSALCTLGNARLAELRRPSPLTGGQ
jgi:hypothetical protein